MLSAAETIKLNLTIPAPQPTPPSHKTPPNPASHPIAKQLAHPACFYKYLSFIFVPINTPKITAATPIIIQVKVLNKSILSLLSINLTLLYPQLS
jgi:hypothetical protein